MNFEATTTEQEALDASAEYNCDMVEPRMPVGHDGSQPIHSGGEVSLGGYYGFC